MAELLPRPQPELPGKPELSVVVRDGRPLWCWSYRDIRVCHASGAEALRRLQAACLEQGLVVPPHSST